jgi:hypothetical protein
LQGSIDPEWVALVTTGRVSLRYHRKAFSLLNEEPVLSKAYARMIKKWERRRGIRLPTSLREWYSLEGAEERLRVDSESFFPLSLQSALKGMRKVASTPPTMSFPFGSWDPGADCYARCDGSEDPLVDDSYESSGHTFSAFVFRRLWSRLTHSNEFGWEYYPDVDGAEFPRLRAKEPAFGKREIAYLAKHFSEAFHRTVDAQWRVGINPATGEPMRIQAPPSVLRFFSPSVRIEIQCRGNPLKRRLEADWDISANSTEDLVEAVAQHLWGHGTLSETLNGVTKAGKAALTALRRSCRKRQPRGS